MSPVNPPLEYEVITKTVLVKIAATFVCCSVTTVAFVRRQWRFCGEPR